MFNLKKWLTALTSAALMALPLTVISTQAATHKTGTHQSSSVAAVTPKPKPKTAHAKAHTKLKAKATASAKAKSKAAAKAKKNKKLKKAKTHKAMAKKTTTHKPV